MESLNDLLRETRFKINFAGDVLPPDLKGRLESIRNRMWQLFRVYFGVLIALMLVGTLGIAWLVISGRVGQVAAFAGAIGLSGASGGLVLACRSAWTDWTRTSLLIALIEDAPAETVAGVIKTLADKLSAG